MTKAGRAFAEEDPSRTWRLFAETLLVASACVLIMTWTPLGPLRYLGAVALGLVNVRLFIFYHDALHGALFRKSKFGKLLMKIYGLLILTPERIWKDSHNYHHAHTAKIVGASIGSFPVLTVRMYQAATPWQRLQYRLARHWLTMLFGYVTVFLVGMCLRPLAQNARRNWPAALSLFVHFGILAALVVMYGWEPAFRTWMLPHGVSFAAGSYLFFAQHNFPDIEIRDRRDWEFTAAALHSSSMMTGGPVMRWLTGDIGYHHVHHLNSMIPFYRLEEAMKALPELQTPHVTSLAPRDVLACLRTAVWDPDQQRMLTYEELRARVPSRPGPLATT
ncbi:MAG: fatty acid desaturase [Myxococcales bacterium]|nr:fatty acid desaturase [Myxococcales bacterium]